jgi:hypothetical protein
VDVEIKGGYICKPSCWWRISVGRKRAIAMRGSSERWPLQNQISEERFPLFHKVEEGVYAAQQQATTITLFESQANR